VEKEEPVVEKEESVVEKEVVVVEKKEERKPKRWTEVGLGLTPADSKIAKLAE